MLLLLQGWFLSINTNNSHLKVQPSILQSSAVIKCFNKLPLLRVLETKSVLQNNLFKRRSEIIIDDDGYQRTGSLTLLTELDIWMCVPSPDVVFLVSLSVSAPADCVSLRDATVASNHNLCVNEHKHTLSCCCSSLHLKDWAWTQVCPRLYPPPYECTVIKEISSP